MAIEFDGSSEWITLGSGSLFDDIWAGGASISCWLFPSLIDTNQKMWWGKGNETHSEVLEIGGIDVVRLFTDWDSVNGQWTTPITEGVWSHVIITYNSDSTANDPSIYINGVSGIVTEVQNPAGNYVTDNASSFLIGDFNGVSGLTFEGKLENFRVHDFILTAAQAATLGNGFRGPLGGEAGWWPMDTARNANGSSNFDGLSLASSHTIHDNSINSNSGTPVGLPVGKASNAPRVDTLPAQ